MAISGWLEIDTVVERKESRLPRYAVVANSVIDVWKLEGTTVVEGTVNGIELGRRSLKRWDEERWFVDLPERLCRVAGIDTGEKIRLKLRVASEDLPAELRDLLAANASARAVWERLTPSRRRVLREYVLAAKRSTTRQRRARRALANCEE